MLMRHGALPLPARNLWLLLACQAITTLGMMMLVPIMPLYVATLTGLGPLGAAGWSCLALAAPAVGTLCLAARAGAWCDRFGHRRMLLASLAIFVASLLLMACSTSVRGFMLGRLLQGASTLGVVLTAFIGHEGGDASRGRSLGLQESAIAAGSLAGPVIGGIVLDHGSLGTLLAASALLTGAIGVVLWSRLTEPAAAAPDDSADRPARASRVLGCPQVRRWMLAACLTQAAAFALVNVFALYVHARFAGQDSTASLTGSLHAIGWLATLLAGPLWGHLNDRGEPQRHFALAALGCAVSIALLASVDQVWLVALLRVIHGACYAALVQSVLLACARRMPATVHGRMTGVSRRFMVIGQLVGPVLVMALSSSVAAVHLLWLVAVLFVASAWLVHAMPPAAAGLRA